MPPLANAVIKIQSSHLGTLIRGNSTPWLCDVSIVIRQLILVMEIIDTWRRKVVMPCGMRVLLLSPRVPVQWNVLAINIPSASRNIASFATTHTYDL
jgi:hypothetical protein